MLSVFKTLNSTYLVDEKNNLVKGGCFGNTWTKYKGSITAVVGQRAYINSALGKVSTSPVTYAR